MPASAGSSSVLSPVPANVHTHEGKCLVSSAQASYLPKPHISQPAHYIPVPCSPHQAGPASVSAHGSICCGLAWPSLQPIQLLGTPRDAVAQPTPRPCPHICHTYADRYHLLVQPGPPPSLVFMLTSRRHSLARKCLQISCQACSQPWICTCHRVLFPT